MKIHFILVQFTSLMSSVTAWVATAPANGDRFFSQRIAASTVLKSQPDYHAYDNMGPNNNDPNDLKGSIVGDKYILDEGGASPSGKSSIYTAYDKHNPSGEQVVIKFSEDDDALKQELVNFGNLDDELFVEAHDYMEECYFDSQNGINCEPLENTAALVMERGESDLKSYLN